jgi:hypothetical protein
VVAGKLLAKAGLFAFFGKFLKLTLLGLAAAGGSILKCFKRKKNEPESLPATQMAVAEKA